MKPGLLDILACPSCGGRLTLSEGDSPSGEVQSGKLACAQEHSFPVVRGIPRFVPSEGYAGSFGFEWNVHRQTQLDNPNSHESEEIFGIKTGFTPADLKGRLVLDVGCGMGRFSDVASRWGATVVGVDLSTAVDAADANIGRRDNVHLAQADVFKLPFAEETFDFIFSIGVLHHTPDTKAAFDRLPPLLKPGGRISIWLYSGYDQIQWRGSDLLRKLTTHFPKRLLHTLSYLAVPLYYVYRVPILGHALRLAAPVSMHPKAEWRILDTFDWYSPRYQWKHTYEEVFAWFEHHGLTDIRVLGMPIAVTGTREAVANRQASARPGR